MQELDFHKSKKRHQKNKSSSAEIYINSKTPLLMNTNRKRVRPDDHNAFQQDADLEENLNFDGMLLNLLFNSYNKTIKQKSLELILNNFNQKLILKDSLREICLLPTGPLRDKLRRMKFIILKINLYAKKLVLLTDTFDSKTGVKEDQELRKIKINTKNNVDELNGLIQKKSDGVEMAFIQKMAKALGAHDSLLRFVKEDWS